MCTEVLKTAPAVFAVGNTYQITVLVSCPTLMWVKVGSECYYDHSNGIMRSRSNLHKVTVPMDKLDKEKKYTVCYRKIIERKPYFTETEDAVELEFEFKPVDGSDMRAYHIADAHNMVDEPVRAVHTFEEKVGKLDFLIMNGDLPDHSGAIENFDTIYEIAAKITNGEIPIVFARGNHDMRGVYAECIADYTPCQNGNSYYSFRLGSIWGLVLDCGEDKEDSHPEYGNTVCSHAFRLEQTKYIKNVIENAKSEYLADGVTHKLVIVHNPFTEQLKPPFDIEKEIYSEWAKLLNDNIKPDVMICGHFHRLGINMPGDENDHLGAPCPVVIGSKPDKNNPEKWWYAGCGFEFCNDKIKVTFTDSDGNIIDTKEV